MIVLGLRLSKAHKYMLGFVNAVMVLMIGFAQIISVSKYGWNTVNVSTLSIALIVNPIYNFLLIKMFIRMKKENHNFFSDNRNIVSERMKDFNKHVFCSEIITEERHILTIYVKKLEVENERLRKELNDKYDNEWDLK